jgi:predicted nucleic acid-binding protein
MTRKIYIDSCVLMLALKAAEDDVARRAIAEISQEGIEYVFSPLVELEVLPQPMKHKAEQVAFYEEWFKIASRVWYDEAVHKIAIDQASQYSIAPMDAAHVATAIIAGADELVTAEKPTKPMFSSREMSVRSIRGV